MNIVRMAALSAIFCISSLVTMANAGNAAADVTVNRGFVRAVPPVMKTSAVFMDLRNNSGTDHALLKAYSNAARHVELHSHINDGGVMRMRRVPRIDIPAKGVAELHPGGYHVMLIGLNQAMTKGDSVFVDLEFEDGSRQKIKLPVLKKRP